MCTPACPSPETAHSPDTRCGRRRPPPTRSSSTPDPPRDLPRRRHCLALGPPRPTPPRPTPPRPTPPRLALPRPTPPRPTPPRLAPARRAWASLRSAVTTRRRRRPLPAEGDCGVDRS
ncbi:MAG: hypothetical protein CMH34_05730 [Microbacterium sp.]|nr:hypothetical protein [Microbacterium sp.]